MGNKYVTSKANEESGIKNITLPFNVSEIGRKANTGYAISNKFIIFFSNFFIKVYKVSEVKDKKGNSTFTIDIKSENDLSSLLDTLLLEDKNATIKRSQLVDMAMDIAFTNDESFIVVAYIKNIMSTISCSLRKGNQKAFVDSFKTIETITKFEKLSICSCEEHALFGSGRNLASYNITKLRTRVAAPFGERENYLKVADRLSSYGQKMMNYFQVVKTLKSEYICFNDIENLIKVSDYLYSLSSFKYVWQEAFAIKNFDDKIYATYISYDESIILTAFQTYLKIYDTKAEKILREVPFSGQDITLVNNLCMSKDSKLIAFNNEYRVFLYNIEKDSFISVHNLEDHIRGEKPKGKFIEKPIVTKIGFEANSLLVAVENILLKEALYLIFPTTNRIK